MESCRWGIDMKSVPIALPGSSRWMEGISLKIDLRVGGLCLVQTGQSPGITNATVVYASEAIYKLIMRPTNSIVNLVVANQTFVNDPSGMALRTVELSIVRVSQPTCETGVRYFCSLLVIIVYSL